jgi:hypothetical protein
MIGPGYDQPNIRYFARDDLQGIEHRLQPFVGAPFPESQNPVFGISPVFKLRVFRVA